jgi:chemotaxis protein CheD
VRPDITQIVIGTGEFHFSSARVCIRTLLGSCVAFTAWHPIRRIGGMCHYLLPAGETGKVIGERLNGLYAEEAVVLFEQAFRASGTQARDYVVNMFGGGSMFPHLSLGESCDIDCNPKLPPAVCRDVACKNVTQGKSIFTSRGFVIAGEDVGGLGSRQLIFDVWSGHIWIRRSKVVTEPTR